MKKHYNFSYATIDDVYACLAEERELGNTEEVKALESLADDLEKLGYGEYDDMGYYLRDTRWGTEIVSECDLDYEREVEGS